MANRSHRSQSHYHAEGSEGADEGLRETPGLGAGILPLLQHSYKTSEPWIRIDQPAADTEKHGADMEDREEVRNRREKTEEAPLNHTDERPYYLKRRPKIK